MPYIATDANRYLGEHTCHCHHYDDQTMVRPCCVGDAKARKANLLYVAITTSHPAYVLFEAAWNSLTDAERWIVGGVQAVYDHGPAGFVEVAMQTEMARAGRAC